MPASPKINAMSDPSERSAFYLDELNEWGNHIDDYHQEAEELEDKLTALIRRNSVPRIAERTGEQLQALERISTRLHVLQLEIAEMEQILNPENGELLPDDQLDASLEARQAALRLAMQEAEKAYIDTRYSCHRFIADTFHSG